MANKKDEIILLSSQHVASLLTNTLSDSLCYHDLSHTKYVVDAVSIIGEYEQISEEAMEICIIAAWFHDTGFSEVYSGHETVSQQIARKFLSEHNYPSGKLQQVLEAIQATKMPQNPQSLIDKILCDADMFHMSQSDYWEKNVLLRKEFATCLGSCCYDDQWYANNLKFLKTHQYFTSYGQKVLEPQKAKHLQINLQKLEAPNPNT